MGTKKKQITVEQREKKMSAGGIRTLAQTGEGLRQ